MSGSKFSIQAAIKSGYLFVGREWAYLARLALLPFGVDLITDLVIYFQKVDTITFLEDFLYSLPSIALSGWLMFVQARLLLTGERPPHLSSDPEFLHERRRALSASVLVWILFNMARATIISYLVWSLDKDTPLVKFAALVLLGGGIWGVRFWVANILAGVGYPIRRYIFQVNGIGISLRLAGLYILTCLPIWVLEQGLTSMILAGEQKDMMIDMKTLLHLPQNTAIALLTLLSVTDIITCVLSTATFCYALKEVLGRPQQERVA